MSHPSSTPRPRSAAPTSTAPTSTAPTSTAGGAAPAAPPAPPQVVLRWSSGRPVLVLGGEVDVSTTTQLRSVRALLDRRGERVTVEASGVTFLDVAGLSALVELAGPGGALLVLHPSPAVLRLLDLLRSSGLGPLELRAGPREEAVVLREPSSADPTTDPTTDPTAAARPRPSRPAARRRWRG